MRYRCSGRFGSRRRHRRPGCQRGESDRFSRRRIVIVESATMAQTTLFSKADIDRRVAEMGAEITRDLAGSDLIALCVLKGAMFFCSDLMRQIAFDVALDFIQISSYGNQKTSSGVVTILKEPQLDMRDRTVLIIEDIIDSGLSMQEVHRYVKLDKGAREVRTATFLD